MQINNHEPAVKKKKALRIKRKTVSSLLFHIFVLAFGAAMLYPLIWMISSSFMTNADIFGGLHFFPRNPTFNNYISGFRGVMGYSFWRFLGNSLFLAGLNIIGNIITCSMAAYAFAKIPFKLSAVLFGIMMATLMLPMHVRLIPQYIVFNNLGWIDTFLPLLVPSFFATSGFFIFLLTQFMRGISNEMLDAPRIDGCNTFQIYLYFMLPLSLPGLVTVAIFSFIGVWNDFFSQMLYLIYPSRFTVAVALRMFIDPTGASAWGALFAMSLVSLVPLFAIFIIFQQYLIEGIQSGSLKG